MNNLTKTLLGSVALTALAASPAFAGKAHPAMHVTAAHTGGKVVNKTNMHNQKAGHITYTFGVYTYQSASNHSPVDLVQTFYKWNSYSTLCSTPKMKLKVGKKTTYGTAKAGTETYSFGCPSGPTVFHGVVYTNNTGTAGQTDTATSDLKGKFKNSRGKYKGSLNIISSIFLQ
jgi:hypothetical protein